MFDSDICDPEITMFNAYKTIREMLLADGLFNIDIDDEVRYFKVWREHMATTPKNYDPIKNGSFQSSCIKNLKDMENNLPEETSKHKAIEHSNEQSDTDPDYWECECPWDMLPIHATFAETYCSECDRTENEVADARKVDIAHMFTREERKYVALKSEQIRNNVVVGNSLARGLTESIMGCN